MKLDIGCGSNLTEGFEGLDVVAHPGVKYVRDIHDLPWPIPDKSCTVINASHVLEHLHPWKVVDVMNEIHRIAKEGCQFLIHVPHGGYPEFHFDPTHTIAWMPESFGYFAPNMCDGVFYNIYKPKPWRCHEGFPTVTEYPAVITVLFIKDA